MTSPSDAPAGPPYLESIGNPPKFARTARRVGRTMPVLTVAVGRSAAGGGGRGPRREGGYPAGHPAGPVRAGRHDRRREPRRAARHRGALASQPVPAGGRVGVVSNTRGAAVLAADACGDAGLQVACLAADTQRALRDMLGPEALVAGPVDTTVLAGPGSFRRCLELVGADPGVDAVLALTTTTAGGDLVPEVGAARLPVPIAAAVLDQVEVVRLLPGPGHDSPAVPAYAYPESAVRALGHAARYGTWRASPPGRVPDLAGLRQDRASEPIAPGVLAEPITGRLAGPGPHRGAARLLRRAAGRQHRGHHGGRRGRGGGPVRRPRRAPRGRLPPAAHQRRPRHTPCLLARVRVPSYRPGGARDDDGRQRTGIRAV